MGQVGCADVGVKHPGPAGWPMLPPLNSQQIAPAAQHAVPQHVDPAAHAWPPQGVATHVPF